MVGKKRCCSCRIILYFCLSRSQPNFSLRILKEKMAKCFCKVNAKQLNTSGGKILYRCGTELNFKNGVLGCNYSVYDEDLDDFKAGLKKVKPIHGLRVQNFPRCEHGLITTIKMSRSAKNPQRLFFVCPVEVPNK